MSKLVKFCFMPLALALCLAGAALGQETTGGIEVTIKDAQGNAVPGVAVTVQNRARADAANPSAPSTTAFTRTVTTDADGTARLLQVPPGVYSVSTAAVSGFAPSVLNDVEVVLGKTTPVNLSLRAGGVQETVTVSAADVVAIDPTDNKIQTNITAQVAELLPKGTNFASLLKVSPATRPEPLAGGYQVDGASGSENTFIIDGQEVTNFRTGALNANFNLPFQLVQEVQVKTSGFEAEFGGATGGVVNVVTKGGTNEWHGEFGAQFRPYGLQAGPRRFLRNFRTGSVASGTFVDIPEYIQPVKDKGFDFFPSATLSGPVIKDRFWFFASYAPQIFHTDRTINYIAPDPRARTSTPLATETYNFRQRNEYALLRLDGSPSDKLRLSGSFTWDPIKQQGALPLYTDIVNAVPSATFGGRTLTGAQFLNQQGGRQNSNIVNGQAVWTPTANLVVNVRAGRTFLNEKLASYGIPDTTRYLCTAASSASVAALGGCFPGFQNFASNYQTAFDVSTRKTFDVDANYLVNNFGGRHAFKFGYQFNGISNDTAQGYRNTGIVVLTYGLTIDNLTGQTPTPGAIGSGYVQRFATQGKASSNNQGLFVQDSWQPNRRASINLGIRLERENVPSFSAGNPGINFGWGKKPAPRLGFAYDLTGDGKTKLFASFGWFYDRFKYELPRGSFGGDFFRRDYFEIFPSNAAFTNFNIATVVGNFNDPVGGACPDTGFIGSGLSRCQFDFRIPSNSGLGLGVSGAVDPDIKAARQTEFTVGFERDLGGGFLLRSRYTHKQVDRAIEDLGIPTPDGSEAYIIGNPGFGLAAQVTRDNGYVVAKAIRKYDAFEFQLDKRLTKRYYFNANYTYSRLFGNYPGLADSFELIAATNQGRTSPNVSRLFDLPFQAFTASGKPALGRLPTDRPHVLKFYGAYTQDWRGRQSTEFSTFFTAQSGTPLTTFFTFFNLNPTFLNPFGDLGRTHMYSQTDFAIRHKIRVGKGERYTLVADLDILNLFNQSNELHRQTTLGATNITGGSLGTGNEVNTIQQYLAGNLNDAIRSFINNPARPDRRLSTFNQSDIFQAPREVRFGFRLMF